MTRSELLALAEPVAWQYWNEKSNSWNTTTSKVVADIMHESGRVVAPLYLAPPAREPLTNEQMTAIFRKTFKLTDSRPVGQVIQFVRAIEQAHGIGSEK